MRTRRCTGEDHQRGYIMALLLIVMSVMGIMLMKAMPSIIGEVQREKEEELIFRGEAIAVGIAQFKARTGNYPLTLEALIDIKPHVLRKLYKDPMVPDGTWDLITAVQPGPNGNTVGLPIVGVRSRCRQDSIKLYRGQSLISDWVFSATDNIYGVPPPNAPSPGMPSQRTGRRQSETSSAGPNPEVDQ